MDINEVRTPYCYIKRTPDDKNPIPFYNPSCLFSSYVKDAVISVSNLFNIKKLKNKNEIKNNNMFMSDLNNAKGLSSLDNKDESKQDESKKRKDKSKKRRVYKIEPEFKTFCGIFDGIFFSKPPDWVYSIITGSMITESDNWIHFLVNNSSADAKEFENKLFIFSSIHCCLLYTSDAADE